MLATQMYMTMQNLKFISKLLVILLSALALKYHYSTASVNELRWVLAPTTRLVELITGIFFTFEPHAGYMSDDNTFLIAASCAGINFLIVAFLLLTLAPLWRGRDLEWRALPMMIAVAYAATLVANATRIVIAMLLQRADLGGEGVHRIEGVVVYFIFLILLFAWSERKRSNLIEPWVMGYALGVYYLVTLGIPIVRGEFLKPEFWQHAAVVVGVSFAIVGLLLIALHCRQRRQTYKALGEAASAEP